MRSQTAIRALYEEAVWFAALLPFFVMIGLPLLLVLHLHFSEWRI